jgi:protein ImuA
MHSIAQLRARIGALEGVPVPSASRPAAPLGITDIDSVLPWGGLPAGGLHEIRAERPDRPAAALGFAAFCLGRLGRRRSGPLVWVSLGDELYAPGLAELGLPSERLLLVRPARLAELRWSLEEALRCGAVAGVLGEIGGLDFKAARRLSLAARASGVPALLLNRADPVAAVLTRWLVAAAASEPAMGVGVGAIRWRLTLERCRGIAMGEKDAAPRWRVEVRHATGGIGLVAHSQHRSAEESGRRRAG